MERAGKPQLLCLQPVSWRRSCSESLFVPLVCGVRDGEGSLRCCLGKGDTTLKTRGTFSSCLRPPVSRFIPGAERAGKLQKKRQRKFCIIQSVTSTRKRQSRLRAPHPTQPCPRPQHRLCPRPPRHSPGHGEWAALQREEGLGEFRCGLETDVSCCDSQGQLHSQHRTGRTGHAALPLFGRITRQLKYF